MFPRGWGGGKNCPTSSMLFTKGRSEVFSPGNKGVAVSQEAETYLGASQSCFSLDLEGQKSAQEMDSQAWSCSALEHLPDY